MNSPSKVASTEAASIAASFETTTPFSESLLDSKAAEATIDSHESSGAKATVASSESSGAKTTVDSFESSFDSKAASLEDVCPQAATAASLVEPHKKAPTSAIVIDLCLSDDDSTLLSTSALFKPPPNAKAGTPSAMIVDLCVSDDGSPSSSSSVSFASTNERAREEANDDKETKKAKTSSADSSSGSSSTNRGTRASLASASSSSNSSSTKRASRCPSKPLVVEPLELGCKNDQVMKMVTGASQNMLNVLIQGNAVRCPNNPYTHNQIVPLDILDTVDQIYYLHSEGNEMEFEKIGYSGNMKERYTEEEKARCRIIVTTRAITGEVETELVRIVNDLLKAMAALKDTYKGPFPIYDYCRFCEVVVDRGGNQLDLDKQVYYQLIEIGCQIRYGADVVAEVFSTACKQNGLVKRTEANADKIGKRARRVSTLDETNRPVDANLMFEAANLLSFATEETLPDHLNRVSELLKKPNRNSKTLPTGSINWRLNRFLDSHLVKGSKLQKKCKENVQGNVKKNRGNRNAGGPIDINANDAIVKKYWNGQPFLILKHAPEKGSFEQTFQPKDKPEWRIFEEYGYVNPRNFVFEGFRKRLQNKKLQNSTNQEKAGTLRGVKTINVIKKVYCYPDGENQPILDIAKVSDKKYPGAIVFCLAQLVDKKEKEQGKQKKMSTFFAHKQKN